MTVEGEATKAACLALGHKLVVRVVQPYGDDVRVKITNCPICCWVESEEVRDA